MPAANSAMKARVKEFAADIDALDDTDYASAQFTQWYDEYDTYVKNGLPPSGQHPTHKPPVF